MAGNTGPWEAKLLWARLTHTGGQCLKHQDVTQYGCLCKLISKPPAVSPWVSGPCCFPSPGWEPLFCFAHNRSWQAHRCNWTLQRIWLSSFRPSVPGRNDLSLISIPMKSQTNDARFPVNIRQNWSGGGMRVWRRKRNGGNTLLYFGWGRRIS